MINDLLKQLGFNDKETEVYLAVLKHGKITPGSLATVVNLKRTTVYSIAKELVKKGVVSEDLGSSSLYLLAKPPQELENLIKKDQKELEEKKLVVSKAVEELKNIGQAAVYQIPKIVFVQENEVENHLYKATPRWDESILKYDGTWWRYQDHSFVQYYEDWIDWYWEKGSIPLTQLKLLSNESAETIKKKKFTRRQIKFWDKSNDFSATTWINGDYVIMIVTTQKPHYLVEIHDAVLAHNMRELFKGIWNEVT